MFGPDLLVPELLGAGLSDHAVGGVCVSPSLHVRESLSVGPYVVHPLTPTGGIKVKDGRGQDVLVTLAWGGAKVWKPLSLTVTCSRGLGGLGTRPPGRKPSTEPGGSWDGCGG